MSPISRTVVGAGLQDPAAAEVQLQRCGKNLGDRTSGEALEPRMRGRNWNGRSKMGGVGLSAPDLSSTEDCGDRLVRVDWPVWAKAWDR
jgi:hypothetical protein